MNPITILTHLSLGFITSFLGTLPPGAINLEILRLSIQKKKQEVIRFMIGIIIPELIYTYVAVLFSGYLASIPNLEKYIQYISIPVLSIIGISYFFIKAPLADSSAQTVNSKNSFVKGLSYGFFNPLQVPFWITYSTYFLSVGWIIDNSILLSIFVLGAILGTIGMLVLIALFSSKYIAQMNLKVKLVNNFMGIVFLLLAAFQVINLLTQ